MSLFSLERRVILVTGGGGLLGLQHGMAIAEAGGTVIVADISMERAEAAAEKISAAVAGGAGASNQVAASRNAAAVPNAAAAAIPVALDVTDEDSLATVAAWIRERFGALHGLVNNAANNPTMSDGRDPANTRLERFDLAEWDADLRVGLTGAFLCAKHFSPLMPAGSSIVNISSDLGLIAPDQRLYRKDGLPEEQQPVKPVSYSAVKSGLIGLTRYLATYWEDGRIRCNALCPGGVENDQDPELQRRIRDRIPMGRMARPDEYHGSLVFLLSPASAYLNGAVIAADGGRTAW